jgi:AcrR family transcriptional regulator
MSLVLDKDYDAITVQDLLDEADVGRATFYAHYAGKDDLLRKGFDHLRADLAEGLAEAKLQGRSERLAFSPAMFEHADKYKHVYRALIGSRASPIVLREFRRVLLEVVRLDLAEHGNAGLPRDLVGRFVADALQSVLLWWVESRPELAWQDVDTMFRQLVLPSLATDAQASVAPR